MTRIPQSIYDPLSRLEISTLYYMAPVDNLRSIAKIGILSYNQAKRFDHRSIASEEVQSRRDDKIIPLMGKSIHDYVPLYFTTRTPMQYVITTSTSTRQRVIEQDDLVFIEINALAVFCQSGALFSDGNAAASKTKYYSDPNELFKLDWKNIRFPNIYSLIRNDWEWQRVKQSEVLVPERIPVGFFKEIVVYSDKARRKVRRICKGLDLPKVTVSKHMIDSSHYFWG